MINSSPCQIGDVYKTIDATKINEDTEIRNSLDEALKNKAFLKLDKYLFALLSKTLFEKNLVGYHNVFIGMADLYDTNIKLL